jgi:hypothetical protein
MRFRPNILARAVALLAAAALTCAAPQPAAAQETVRTWSLTANGSDVTLHVKYERRSGGTNHIYSSVRTVPLTALHGLRAGEVGGPPARRRFEIGHDAGKLVFDGTVGDGRGSGTYDVEPDPAFQRELARRGIRPATNDELLELALGDFKLALLDAALASGFERPTPEDLVNANNRGITADYLRGFKDVPLVPKSLRAIALLRDHGVRPALIQAAAASSYRGLSATDLTALSDHGVPGEYLASLDRAGVRASVADVIRLHDNGVTVAYIQRLHDHGYAHLSADDIIKLSQHGV